MTATSEISMVWSMIDAWCTVTGTLCQQILQAHFNWARDLPGVAGLISNTSGWISSVLYVESWKWMKNMIIQSLNAWNISKHLEHLEIIKSRVMWKPWDIHGHNAWMGRHQSAQSFVAVWLQSSWFVELAQRNKIPSVLPSYIDGDLHI